MANQQHTFNKKLVQPLELTARKDNWTISAIHGTKFDEDERMKKVYSKIIQRDKYTCQYCGWKSKDFQEVHHLDHNHNNFDESNLITACPLCHQIFHLPLIYALKGGDLIWLPEMTQEQLNNLCINLFIAKENKTFANIANNYLIEFSKRKGLIDGILGRGIGHIDVGVFSEVMVELDPSSASYQNVQKSIRILPNESRFKSQIDYWIQEKDVLNEKNKYFKDFERKYYKDIAKILDKENENNEVEVE